MSLAAAAIQRVREAVYFRTPPQTTSASRCLAPASLLLARAAVTRGDTRGGWTRHRHGSPFVGMLCHAAAVDAAASGLGRPSWRAKAGSLS